MPGPRAYSDATRAALVDVAGGTCYFPGCDRPLIVFVEGEPYTDYHIAHIRDASPGNRYDAATSDDERRAYKNLLLLCKPHHDLVDKRHPDRYSVADLQGWKESREVERRPALEQIGTISEDRLEELLRGAAITIEDSVVSLGGQGGNAPGGGGGGGGAIGSGVGGPGGAGGDIHMREGTPGTAPGAGGGGAGSVGPAAFGAEGGGGGDIASGIFEVEPGATFRVGVGEGGTEGRDGGETRIGLERPDGTVDQLLSAAGGKAGRSGVALGDEAQGPALRVTSAFLADDAQVRDGLVFVLGGGWDFYEAQRYPAILSGALVIIAEPVTAAPRITELLFEVKDEHDEARASATLQVELPDQELPVRLARVFKFVGVEVESPGTWAVTARSAAVELVRVPFRITPAVHRRAVATTD